MKVLTLSFGDVFGPLWQEAMGRDLADMKQAASLAMDGAASLARVRGRSNIEAAGFGKKWQNTLKATRFPNRENVYSLDSKMSLIHKIAYAGVFEDGDTIHGRPYLWVPLSSTPKRFGRGHRLTPSTFKQGTGQPLIPFRDPHTGNLLLGVRVKVAKKVAASGAALERLSLSKIRRGTSGKTGVEVTIPVFVALRQVTLRKRFALGEVVKGVATEVPGLYVRNMEAIHG